LGDPARNSEQGGLGGVKVANKQKRKGEGDIGGEGPKGRIWQEGQTKKSSKGYEKKKKRGPKGMGSWANNNTIGPRKKNTVPK